MPITPVQVLLLCGPAGAGKSTLGWEIAAQLRRLGIGHVLLDSDELDRAWPLTTAEQDQLNRANLTAFWAFERAGPGRRQRKRHDPRAARPVRHEQGRREGARGGGAA
jgi:ABC-type cobalamin/Fe3+-siderophores transport system ATPase subunit